MSRVRVHISTSLDGYVAGPNQSQEEPLGEGGEGLHEWVIATMACSSSAAFKSLASLIQTRSASADS